MESMKNVVTVTMNPALDKSAAVENVVAERKLRCDPPQWQPGGGGINVARVVHRLGGDPLAIYTRGGPTGEMFREMLDEEAVRQKPVSIAGLTRESFAVLEKSTGQQYRFGMPGPEVQESEWRGVLDLLDELEPLPEYVVLSGGLPRNVPEDFYARVARRARGNDQRVIVDSSGAPLREAAEVGVFLLKPNLRELRELTGEKLAEEKEQHEAIQSLVQEGRAHAVLLSLGAAGAMLATKDGLQRLRAPTVKIRSKVGAGDSMVGGLVHALARSWSVADAARYAVAAGAAAVKTPGSELCHRQDVEALHQRLLENGTGD
jgi:6-phosphofructokinase 2